MRYGVSVAVMTLSGGQTRMVGFSGCSAVDITSGVGL
jgi:hypothetical protein